MKVTSFLPSCRIKADGQTAFFKLMGQDYHGEVAKFSKLVWFRFPARQPKLAGQWKEEHLMTIRGSPERIRRKPRDEHWNLDSVKAVLVRP